MVTFSRPPIPREVRTVITASYVTIAVLIAAALLVDGNGEIGPLGRIGSIAFLAVMTAWAFFLNVALMRYENVAPYARLMAALALLTALLMAVPGLMDNF